MSAKTRNLRVQNACLRWTGQDTPAHLAYSATSTCHSGEPPVLRAASCLDLGGNQLQRDNGTHLQTSRHTWTLGGDDQQSADSRTCISRSNFGDRVSWLPAQSCWHPSNLCKWTSTTNSLSGCWRLICLGVETVAHWDHLLNCVAKFSYFLTYLWCGYLFCSTGPG